MQMKCTVKRQIFRLILFWILLLRRWPFIASTVIAECWYKTPAWRPCWNEMKIFSAKLYYAEDSWVFRGLRSERGMERLSKLDTGFRFASSIPLKSTHKNLMYTLNEWKIFTNFEKIFKLIPNCSSVFIF